MTNINTTADVSFEIDAEEIVDDARITIEEIATEAAENVLGDSALEDIEERVEALEAKLAKLLEGGDDD